MLRTKSKFETSQDDLDNEKSKKRARLEDRMMGKIEDSPQIPHQSNHPINKLDEEEKENSEKRRALVFEIYDPLYTGLQKIVAAL